MGGEKRTFKVLLALAKSILRYIRILIVKGCWILPKDFALNSLELGDWISEKEVECENYPLKSFRDKV